MLKARAKARAMEKEATLGAAVARRARRARAPRQVETIMEKERARGHPLPPQLIVAKERERARARAHLHLQVIAERAKERAVHHLRGPPRVAERSYCVIRSLFKERIEATLAYSSVCDA